MKNVRDIVESIISAGITVKLNTIRGQNVYSSFEIERSEDNIVLSAYGSDMKLVEISFKLDNDTVLMSFIATTPCSNGAAPGFKADESAIIELNGLVDPDEMRYYYHEYTCWTHSATTRSFDSMHPRTQSVIARYGNTHAHMLMLCGDNFKAMFKGRAINVASGNDNIRPLSGAVLSITTANDPSAAVRENLRALEGLAA